VAFALALGASMLAAGACTRKVGPPPTAPGTPTGPIVTPDSVQAIFDNHCITCHSGSSAPAGMDLSADSSFANIVDVVSIKCAPLVRIRPFNPDSSCLMRRIDGRVLPRMPLSSPALSPADTSTVRNWILQGAHGVVKPA